MVVSHLESDGLAISHTLTISQCILMRRRKDVRSNLVDSASSIRLSQRLSHACLSINDYTVKLRMAHYISYSLFDGLCYLDNRSNSRANTCINPRLPKGCIY